METTLPVATPAPTPARANPTAPGRYTQPPVRAATAVPTATTMGSTTRATATFLPVSTVRAVRPATMSSQAAAPSSPNWLELPSTAT